MKARLPYLSTKPPSGARLWPGAQRILLANGCNFVRQGKGDHEIWHSPISDRTFTVDASVKKKYTAEASLKQAGINERIE